MTENELPTKLIEQSDAIDMLRTQLTWILNQCEKIEVQPSTDIGNELVSRLFSLYKDFNRVFQRSIKLVEEIRGIKFNDKATGLAYEISACRLLCSFDHPDFQNFVSIVETGELPDSYEVST